MLQSLRYVPAYLDYPSSAFGLRAATYSAWHAGNVIPCTAYSLLCDICEISGTVDQLLCDRLLYGRETEEREHALSVLGNSPFGIRKSLDA